MSLPSVSDTEFQASANTPNSKNASSKDGVNVIDVEEECGVNDDDDNAPYTKKKRKKTSATWVHFRTITNADRSEFHQCVHCGSEYPTSNLFLIELYVIKEALDTVALAENDCMRSMACKMKEKFDKYWGSSNLLISIGAVLDPRYKMELIKLSFKTIYSANEAREEEEVVRDTLEELFNEYVEAHKESNVVQSSSANNGSGSEIGPGHSKSSSNFMTSRFGKGLKSGTAKYAQHIRSVDTIERVKSELTVYLDEGVHVCETGANFDVLGWWKENRHKYKILSKMAADILSIPITTVASESAFSAGGRVIEPHRSCLGTKMVDMLVCGADWYRHYYGLHKKKIKENEDVTYIELE